MINYFEITTAHLRLLAAVQWGWNREYEGAPFVDPKRPFGFSGSLAEQIGQTIGEPLTDMSQPQYIRAHDRMMSLWAEMLTVVEIVTQNALAQAGILGEYARAEGTTWLRTESQTCANCGARILPEKHSLTGWTHGRTDLRDTAAQPAVACTNGITCAQPTEPEHPVASQTYSAAVDDQPWAPVDPFNRAQVQWGVQLTWPDGTTEYEAHDTRAEAESRIRIIRINADNHDEQAELVSRTSTPWKAVQR